MEFKILTTDSITTEILDKILKKKICGLHIPRYVSSEVADKLSKYILSIRTRDNYQAQWMRKNDLYSKDREYLYEDTDVERAGLSDSRPKDKGHEPGFSNLEYIISMRSAIFPHLSPIDRLRLELDEILPQGANIRFSSNGEKSLVGIGRIMKSSRELLHADVGRKHCLTANIYLNMPTSGGGVSIWQYEGDFLNAHKSYMFSNGEIPEETPKTYIKPENGDLLIWNPSCPHVVEGFDDATRVTCQTWLKMISKDDKLAKVVLLN